MAATYDLVVVGAGWFGLSSAKAYLDFHPQEKILVVEASGSCGGTWSKDRLYPGLKSNNIVGSYEHPDLPMSEAVYGVKPGEHIPAAVLHQYLTDFAKKFGVFERTRFNTKVDTVEPSVSGGWQLHVSTGTSSEVIETKRLIIASGLTSTPNFPQYPGQESFTAPFFHAKDFCVRGDIINKAKRAVVIGGAKSAFDVAYAFAAKGDVDVDMVIREKGQGPVWLCPAYVTPLKRRTEELLHTRLLTWFSPCPWGTEDGFAKVRNFLHSTAIGRWLVRGFWKVMSNDVITLNAYDKNPLVSQLKPWNSILWTGSGVSIHNYETNFFDLVKSGKIRIHTTDVSKLDGNTVYPENGKAIETDVVVCATGWKKDPTFKFQNLGEAGLGLPYTAVEKTGLSRKADEDVLKMFPSLRNQPILKTPAPESDPLRLYRFVVPPTMVAKRNLAFAGMVSTVSTSIFAAVQGLWITAYFDGNLDRIASSQQEITDEVMLHTQWGKWRYPCGYGARLPDFAFDALCYIDLMLRDLGLKNHRKKSQMEEIFKPYKPTDYAGLVEEWEAGHDGYPVKVNGIH
ncbi:putative dimethylaniline monooxygenase [Mollisia scopiformis]|uniref:Putative dimethylaniline monooxygenase n=1 Tax=Mollisia scopiformis TaxID=149040 RepID=A0A194XBQ3_MOLSC|nr:putative dimethylaniline monooxygenase [Mollisia scopiformis]KUJ17596.1 putative dimethylaniline monooxygenase [Mollisia scopiformis]